MCKSSVKAMLKGTADPYAIVLAVAKLAREICNENNKTGRVTTEKAVNVAIDEFQKGNYEVLMSKN